MQLHELVDHVIGVDTHRDTNTAAVIDANTTGVVEVATEPTTTMGYESLLELANCHSAADTRAWAIEGTGSYGAGLAAFLADRGEWVIEVDRPSRPARRDGSKSDELDAARAAREVLGRTSWASPRTRGPREAMRVLVATRAGAVRDRTRAINQLKGTIVSAPDQLRSRLRGAGTHGTLIDRCRRLRHAPTQSVDYNATAAAIRRLAERIAHLETEIRQHDRDIEALTKQHCPQLLAEYGIGANVAAQAFISWSHHGRCRNDAAFANLAGAAPIEASSGATIRRRLNRGGDRQLNRALHTVVMARARGHEPTRTYIAGRIAQGKSEREARRCLKRFIARRIYRLLETGPDPLDKT